MSISILGTFQESRTGIMEPGTTTVMAFTIPRKRLDTTSEPRAVSTTSCGPFSLLPIGQLCYKEQLPQPWVLFHARVLSRSWQAASLFPNFNLLAAREEFLERKRLQRVWLLDKQANGSKRLVSTVWGELSLGLFPSPGACLPSSFGASISSLTKHLLVSKLKLPCVSAQAGMWKVVLRDTAPAGAKLLGLEWTVAVINLQAAFFNSPRRYK